MFRLLFMDWITSVEQKISDHGSSGGGGGSIFYVFLKTVLALRNKMKKNN